MRKGMCLIVAGILLGFACTSFASDAKDEKKSPDVKKDHYQNKQVAKEKSKSAVGEYYLKKYKKKGVPAGTVEPSANPK